MWPLFYSGVWKSPPSFQHPRLMIFGFGVAFVTGFLGTAWPRHVESRPMRSWELTALVLLWFAAQIAWLLNRYQIGDLLIGAQLLFLLSFLLQRSLAGKDRAPPGLWIACLGPLLGWVGACLISLTFGSASGTTYALARLFSWQGMLLLPLMGVGAIIYPRFFPESGTARNDNPEHSLRTLIAVALVVASFLIEAIGWLRFGNALRFAAVLWWAMIAFPIVVHGSAASTRAWALRVGLGCIAASFLIRAIWPGPGYAMEHLMFLAGFGLTMTLVAERVTLGHADCPPGPREKSRRWQWLAWLLLVAASTRMSADIKASLIVSHHSYAALIWIGVLVAWAWPLLRHWRRQPTA